MGWPKRRFDDDFSHHRARAYIRSRAQAAFRHEAWTLTLEEYFSIWSTPELWAQRGRASEDLVLTRTDEQGAWAVDNVEIKQRRKHLQEQRGKTKGRHSVT